MTHEDAGKYAAKHPAGTRCDPAIAAVLKEKARDGRVTCAAAHAVAGDFEVAPSEIGKSIDLLEYRIIECQLGLYGYLPERKIVKAADTVSEDLRDHLQPFSAAGEISCASSWEIARALGLERMAVAAACENMGIKIKHCQLGAF